jgi:hypothetical protein
MCMEGNAAESNDANYITKSIIIEMSRELFLLFPKIPGPLRTNSPVPDNTWVP